MAAPEVAAPRVSGVILAAGRSTRFGSGPPKQLYRVSGEPLVHRTARITLASRLDSIVVVVGHQGRNVTAAVSDLAVEVVDNPDFAEGQSTSVRAGLSRIEREADAAVFIPCDLPNLDGQTIDRLIEAYTASRPAIVVPVFEGQRRAPVLIERSLFEEIETITGDRGARQLFSEHEGEIVEVTFESAVLFEDLDRP